MVSSVAPSSSLSTMFFQNRFPEREEEPLLEKKSASGNAENSSAAPVSAVHKQEDVVQKEFSRAMREAALPGNNEEAALTEQNNTVRNGKSAPDHSAGGYDPLLSKAQYTALFLA